MFIRTPKSGQLDLFTSSRSFLSGNALKTYDDTNAWHNQFRQQVTMRIDENIFRPLYCQDNGTPNASVRILFAMMILKESNGLSDQKLFEDCRFNVLTRSALGLLNMDDPLPTESTYYLFRKRIVEYAERTGENLFDTAFSQITKDQCIEFEVSGKRIRMDSKLLSSNIAWLSRYELIHETLRLFYKQIKQSDKIDSATKERLDKLLCMKGEKILYTCSNEEVKNRLHELGCLIYKILPLFSSSTDSHYQTLARVFNEQYQVDEKRMVIPRDKADISTKSVQSPHDTDAHYRNKDDQKVKGYSINVTESCDDDKEGGQLNLITHVTVEKATVSDAGFLQESIQKAAAVLTDKIESVHADGAYHSPDNQRYCNENDIQLFLHAIQGAKSRYHLDLLESGELSIFDTDTNQIVESQKVIKKNGDICWRIKSKKGYRYFTQKEIDTYLVRKKIEETPIETLQKRNNVEATIFQLGYHCSNAKSRYRGHIKHQMWANIRCLWVNFVRIRKYVERLCLKNRFFAKKWLNSLLSKLFNVLKTAMKKIFQNNADASENIRFSFI